jgi:hypothetical protein
MAVTKKADPVIRFQAQVWSVRTTVDGGMNVTLSLSDKDIKQVSQLLECKKSNALLEVEAVPIKPEAKTKEKNGSRKRVQRYPYRAKS